MNEFVKAIKLFSCKVGVWAIPRHLETLTPQNDRSHFSFASNFIWYIVALFSAKNEYRFSVVVLYIVWYLRGLRLFQGKSNFNRRS